MELIISKNTKAINTDIALAPKNLKSVPSGECLIGIEHGGSSGESRGYSYEPLISALTKKYNNIYFGYSTSFLESIWYINLLQILNSCLIEGGKIYIIMEEKPKPGRISYNFISSSAGEMQEIPNVPFWKRIILGYEKIIKRGYAGPCKIYAMPKRSFSCKESILGKFHTVRRTIIPLASTEADSEKYDSTDIDSAKYSDAIADLSYYITGSSYKSPILKYIADSYGVNVRSILDFGGGFGAISGDLAQAIGGDISVDVADHSPKNECLATALSGSMENSWGKGMNFFRSTIEEFNYTRKYDIIMFIGSMLYVERQKLKGVLDSAWNHLSSGGLIVVHENIKHKSYSRDFEKMFTVSELEKYLSFYGKIAHFSSSGFSQLSNFTSKYQTVFRVVQKKC